MFTSNYTAWIAASFVGALALGLSLQSFARNAIPYTSVQTSLNESAVVAETGTPTQKPTSRSTAALLVVGMFIAAVLISGLSTLTAPAALGIFAIPLVAALRVLSFGLLVGSVVSAVRIVSPRTTPVVVVAK